jgi:hypothetical protein
MKTLDDLIQCTSCEGFFEPEKTVSSGDDSFCKNCHKGIIEEIFETGKESLVEYLESRKLIADFHVFSHAKWSGVTEEEFKELNPDD